MAPGRGPVSFPPTLDQIRGTVGPNNLPSSEQRLQESSCRSILIRQSFVLGSKDSVLKGLLQYILYVERPPCLIFTKYKTYKGRQTLWGSGVDKTQSSHSGFTLLSRTRVSRFKHKTDSEVTGLRDCTKSLRVVTHFRDQTHSASSVRLVRIESQDEYVLPHVTSPPPP